MGLIMHSPRTHPRVRLCIHSPVIPAEPEGKLEMFPAVGHIPHSSGLELGGEPGMV